METAEQQAKTKSGRKSFLLLCAAFIIPIVLAKMALDQQWFNYGVTNQGQLLAQPVSLEQLELSHIQPDKYWLIVYNFPASCEAQCTQTFNVLSNTYLALGKEMPRVQSVALNTNTNIDQLDTSRWQISQQSNVENAVLEAGKVFVVDPHGNIVLTHQPPNETEQLPAFGKAILADMKKLLKYSRIG